VTLTPGQRLTWPDEAVQKILDMAPEKIRVIEEKPHSRLQPGVWCEWWSPPFGHCTGQVVSMTVKGYIVTNHSVIGPHKQVEIPVDWICGVYRNGGRKGG